MRRLAFIVAGLAGLAAALWWVGPVSAPHAEARPTQAAAVEGAARPAPPTRPARSGPEPQPPLEVDREPLQRALAAHLAKPASPQASDRPGAPDPLGDPVDRLAPGAAALAPPKADGLERGEGSPAAAQTPPLSPAGAALQQAIFGSPRPRAPLERAWEQEREDPRWTEEAVEFMRETLSHAELDGVEITGVSCRTSVCKMRLQLDSMAQGAALTEVASVPEYETAVYPADDAEGPQAQEQEPGSFRYVVYFGRAGQALPAPEAVEPTAVGP